MLDFEVAPLDFEVSECPPHGRAYWLETCDGVRIRIAAWRCVNSTKGTILLLPGRTEYIEKYGRTLRTLLLMGYNAIVLDWRGQGLSQRLTDDRMLGHVDDFSSYQLDVNAALNAISSLGLPKPWNILAHSLGACIGFRTLLKDHPISAAVFTSPMWDINLPPLKRAIAQPFLSAATSLGCGLFYSPGTNGNSYVLATPFDENRLTQDFDMYQYFIRQANALEAHQIGGPSIKWTLETIRETNILASQPSPDIPCLTFCGTDDTVIGIEAVQNRVDRWPDAKISLFRSAKHDILSENYEIRSRAFSQMDDFLIKQAANFAK